MLPISMMLGIWTLVSDSNVRTIQNSGLHRAVNRGCTRQHAVTVGRALVQGIPEITQGSGGH